MEKQLSVEDWNELSRSTVYTYAGKSLKHIFIKALIVSLILILTGVAVLSYLRVADKISQTQMGVILIIIFIIALAYIIKHLQFDVMKALTQYYIDSNNDCYKIKFTKISTKVVRIEYQYSLIPLVGEVKTMIDAVEKLKVKEGYADEAYLDAQNKILGYYYVSRYKQGIRDWDWIHGGDAKVIPLGKADKVRIPAVYMPLNATALPDNAKM